MQPCSGSVMMGPCEVELIYSDVKGEKYGCLLGYFDLYVDGLLIHNYSATVWLCFTCFLQTCSLEHLLSWSIMSFCEAQWDIYLLFTLICLKSSYWNLRWWILKRWGSFFHERCSLSLSCLHLISLVLAEYWRSCLQWPEQSFWWSGSTNGFSSTSEIKSRPVRALTRLLIGGCYVFSSFSSQVESFQSRI